MLLCLPSRPPRRPCRWPAPLPAGRSRSNRAALDLCCSGAGPRTVLLEAGANADSSTWYRVQGLLPAAVRICACDRAGYGYK